METLPISAIVTTYNEDDRVKKVNETYDRLNRKVNKLDDFFIVNSNLL